MPPRPSPCRPLSPVDRCRSKVDALATWVWESFRPGERISEEAMHEESRKILRRCDLNGDGHIDQQEFHDYYEGLPVRRPPNS